MSTDEQWAALPFAPQYTISTHGRIVGVRHALLRPCTYRTGHQQVVIVTDRGKASHFVHALVMRTFVGSPPTAKHECLHRDGNPANNRLSNLRYGTRRENIVDRIRHADRSARALLSYTQVAAIRRAYDGRRGSQVRIARLFGVSPTIICRALSGRTFGVITCP